MRKKPKYVSTNVPGWFRDPRTGATLNLNSDQLRLYREQVERAKQKKEAESKISSLQIQVNRLETLISRLLDEKDSK